MRVKFLFGIVMLAGIASVQFASAQPMDSKADSAMPKMEAPKPADSVQSTDAGNKFCPISGEKIDESKSAKVEYNGKTYHLCCPACLKDFNKDPEAAIQKIEAREKAASGGENATDVKDSASAPADQASMNMDDKMDDMKDADDQPDDKAMDMKK